MIKIRSAAVLAVAVACVALSGCGTMLKGLPDADRAAVLKGASEHIGKCRRHYWGDMSLGGKLGFDIDCNPASLEEQAAVIAKAVEAAVTRALGGVPALPAAEAEPDD